jgi:hypothetical protein
MMVLVRAVMPVRGVVHRQTASPFGWKGPKLAGTRRPGRGAEGWAGWRRV